MTKTKAKANTRVKSRTVSPDSTTEDKEQAIADKADQNQLQARLDQLEHDLKRALADYQNLVKQTAKEKQQWLEIAQSQMLRHWLPIVDSLYLAQTHLQDEGLELVIRQIRQLWQDLGVEEIRPGSGEEFDPQLHECIDSQPTNKSELKGKIIETTRFGLRWQSGKVIRHAQVRAYSQD